MDARRIREWALSVGAALGVLCLLATLAGVTLQVRPLIFRSGSMGPGIPTGSLGLARTVPASALERGDVVSVLDAGGTRITHRVVDVRPAGDAVELTLRGDANAVPDAEPYVVTRADRLLWSAPHLGYAVSALSGRTAAFAGGLLVGVLIMVTWGRRRPDRPEPPPPVRTRRRWGRAVLGLVVGVAVLTTGAPHRAAAAGWPDSGTAGGTVTTVTVPVGTLSCARVVTTNFSWTAVSGASYSLIIRRADGTVYSTTPIAAGTTGYSTLVVPANGSAVIRAIRYTGQWTSVDSNAVALTPSGCG